MIISKYRENYLSERHISTIGVLSGRNLKKIKHQNNIKSIMKKEELVTKKRLYNKLLIVLASGVLLVAVVIFVSIFSSQQMELSLEGANETRENHKNILQAAEIAANNENGNNLLQEIDTTLKEICNTGSRACGEVVSGECEGMVNLCSLVPSYISEIPRDPYVNRNDPGTGYWISKSHDGSKIGIVLGNKKIPCPSGYVSVPGNPLYGTNDFCAMKYQAKAMDRDTEELVMDGCGGFWDIDKCALLSPVSWSGSNYIPVSVPEASPWVGLRQNHPNGYDAKDACRMIDARLMNNAEWMTIARNVEAVAGNWTGDSPGEGSLIQGNSFRDLFERPEPADEEGEGRERRTFILTNGEVIWDMSGNVWEWLDDSADYAQQPNTVPPKDLPIGVVDSGTWIEWSQISSYGETWDYDFYRASQEEWGTAEGMGKVYIRNADNRIIRRGGRWSDGSHGGIYALNFRIGEHVVHLVTGFRCVK